MARVFIEGFESGGSGLWDSVRADVVAAPTGMSGSYALKLYDFNVNTGVYKDIPSKSEYYFACKLAVSSGNPGIMIAFLNGTTMLGCINVTGGFLIQTYRSSNVWLADGPTLVGGAPTLIEVHYYSVQ